MDPLLLLALKAGTKVASTSDRLHSYWFNFGCVGQSCSGAVRSVCIVAFHVSSYDVIH